MACNSPGNLDLEPTVEPVPISPATQGLCMTAFDECGYTDVRRRGTSCPQCEPGEMQLSE